VDVLSDRSAESVATWLKANPEVTVVALDRTEADASGLTLEATYRARRAQLLHQYQQACTLRPQGLPLVGIALQVRVRALANLRLFAQSIRQNYAAA
jgi:hypothetical protein